MNWVLYLSERARKNLHRFPKKEQIRINKALLEMSCQNPFSGDIAKLESEENLWRRRVGTYRIKFQIKEKEKVIYVYEIERRTSKTY